MSRSVNGAGVGTHGKPLPNCSAGLPQPSAAMGSDGNDSVFLVLAGASRAAVREAMRRADYSQKAMAIDNKVSEGKVSDALAGTRHMPWAWVFTSATLNKELAFHLVTVLAEHLNVNQDSEANAFADICGRMVKMALQRESKLAHALNSLRSA